MLTGKQKHYLRGLAQTTKPTVQVGKNGLTENTFQLIFEALDKREFLKINLLQNTDVTVNELADFLVKQAPEIEIAQKIGHTLVVYKMATDVKNRKLSPIIKKLAK